MPAAMVSSRAAASCSGRGWPGCPLRAVSCQLPADDRGDLVVQFQCTLADLWVRGELLEDDTADDRGPAKGRGQVLPEVCDSARQIR